MARPAITIFRRPTKRNIPPMTGGVSVMFPRWRLVPSSRQINRSRLMQYLGRVPADSRSLGRDGMPPARAIRISGAGFPLCPHRGQYGSGGAGRGGCPYPTSLASAGQPCTAQSSESVGRLDRACPGHCGAISRGGSRIPARADQRHRANREDSNIGPNTEPYTLV